MNHGNEGGSAIRRRRFLGRTTGTLASAAVAALMARPGRARGEQGGVLRFGVVADPQYADIAPAGTRFYRQSPGKLAEAVGYFEGRPLAFCVNLGDLIDRHWASYDAILGVLGRSRHRFHHVLGNHDFDVAEAEKPRVAGRLGRERGYGAFTAGAWTFVILDTNDVSTYAPPADSKARAEAAAELKRITALGWRQAQPWNGGIGSAQLEWFEATCREAARAGRRVIVLAHHPILPDDAHTVWNTPTLLEVLRRHRNVAAWLNGHNHAGAFGVHDGIPCVTFRGMVETESTNAFAEVELRDDRLVIAGHGREPSRELALRRPG